MPVFTSLDRKAFIAFGFASESFNFKQEKTIERDTNDLAGFVECKAANQG